jgi:hypothetical protein
MKKITVAAAFAAMTACSGAVSAADLGRSVKDEPYHEPTTNYILNSNNQIGVHFTAMNFDYLETDNGGAPLDSENGWVPGFGISVSLMKNWIVPNFYFNAQLSWYSGETDYVGAYIGSDAGYGSVKGKTGANVADYDFRVGKGFALGSNFMLTPYFGIGSHDWERKVNEGEDYSHGYYGAGLMLQVSPFKGFVLSGHGLVGQTFSSHIDVAGPDGFSKDLGDSATYRFGVAGDIAITRNLHVNAGVEWVNFDYGQSTVSSSGYYEPDSSTSNVITKVGIGYSFGGDYDALK